MIRAQPTRLLLKQEDLKEYEDARSAWAAKAEKTKDGESSATSSASADVLPMSRQKIVQSRIGITK